MSGDGAITNAVRASPKATVVCGFIQAGQFDLTDEKACQAQMYDWLSARLALDIAREHRLGPADIPDFLIDGRIVVECKKIGANKRATFRQLQRYAKYPQVEALILATGTVMGLPPTIEGKPAYLVNLGRAWL